MLYFLFRPTPPNAYGEPAPNSQSQFAPSRAPEGAGMPPGNMPPMVGDLMNNPMYGMASTVGQQIMGQYGEETKKNLEKYVSIGQLKYYFAVDTSYVAKKLGVLLFPFTRTDWAVKYNQVKQPLFFSQKFHTRKCFCYLICGDLDWKVKKIVKFYFQFVFFY